MTQPHIPTKAEILETLRSTGEQAVARLSAMPESNFDEGRYENGWNGRQILGHVAAIEWTYPRLLEIAKQGTPAAPEHAPREVRRTTEEESAGVPSRPPRGGMDAYNARQVERRAAAPVADLIAEFQRNRAALIAAVEATDESLFATPIRSAGGITGVLGGVLSAVAVEHVLGHVNDIVGSGERGAGSEERGAREGPPRRGAQPRGRCCL
ncbi:MAG: DinB family protein [Chloroflexi bacterium]|nr:DinB family protein [Chloroflexota bacterium]